MKNLVITILMILAISLLISHVINVAEESTNNNHFRQTDGNLNFTVRTVTYNGQYAPRNCGAIWITNSANQFVKTIKVWASQYRYTLVRWNASSGGNTTGAITGASLNNHQLHNVNWNGANYQGTQMADGDYKVNVEFTEHNASASNMGKFKQLTWTKGPDPVSQTPANETYFQNMSLTWTPVVANGTVFGSVTTTTGTPITGALIWTGASSTTSDAGGMYQISLAPGTYDIGCTAVNYGAQTASGVIVTSAGMTEQNFILSVVANDDALNPGLPLDLLTPQPNPFSGQTLIRFKGDPADPIELTIYDLRGQRIRQKTIYADANGQGEIIWNGKDNNDMRCPAGKYIVRVRQGNLVQTEKLMLIQ
jgi:hypothetical protein